MDQTAHYSTIELSNIVLNLRDDLSFSMQTYGSSPCYLIEDSLNSKFFRIGLPEYTFISLLDGRTPLSGAVAAAAAVLGEDALTEDQAASVCKWLIDSQLASTDQSRLATRLLSQVEKGEPGKQLQKVNPIMTRISLFNPDRVLDACAALFGWMVSLPMVVVWLAVCMGGVYCVFAKWSEFSGYSANVLSADNWLWLGLTWVVLKLIHETAHGLVCRKFGGHVRECGVLFLLMIPMPYVDVTSSWRFPSKWQRIFTAAAGMYAELFLAAVAAIVWYHAGPGSLQHHAYNVILTASMITLVFNANPLMRFDGYYMMADWLELPNLAIHGQQYTKYLSERYFLGNEPTVPEWPEGKSVIIRMYAIGSWFWRILICISLSIGAANMFNGAGLIFAAVALTAWVCVPVFKFVKRFIANSPGERINRRWVTGVFASAGIAVWLLTAYVPWFGSVRAPAMIDYAPTTAVRTPVSGFVDKVLVTDGQHVEAGDVLIVLRNEQLELEIKELQVAVERSLLQARKYRRDDQTAAWQVENKNRESLEYKLSEKQEHFGQLTVTATVSGTIVAGDLASTLGTYMAPGRELMLIGSKKEVRALVAQDEYELFVKHTGEIVRVHIWGTGNDDLDCQLKEINPRASVQLPHPAFSSTAGGPLTVKLNPQSEGDERQSWELVEPRFMANIGLDSANTFEAGQMGYIEFRTRRGTIGSVLHERASRWLRKRLDENRS